MALFFREKLKHILRFVQVILVYIYIQPNIKELKYNTTNKSEYKEYKSNPKDCGNCPYFNQCTQSQKHQKKVIMQDVWEEYREQADEIRHTPNWKEIYSQRKT